MNTDIARWALGCALALGGALAAAPVLAADLNSPTTQPSEALLEFERAMQHQIANEQDGPMADPFADDPQESMLPDPPEPMSDLAAEDLTAQDSPAVCYEAPMCETSCGLDRMWGRVDYLVWWSKDQNLPPLLTTSPDGTLQPAAGVLPGATVLFGGDESLGARSGGRLELGYWLDECENWGVAGRLFGLGNSDDRYQRGSDGSEILGQPFISTVTGDETAALVSFPNVTNGDITIDTSSDVLVSDVFLRRSLITNCNGRVDLLGGYFFSRVDESLYMETTLTGGVLPPGTSLNGFDSFSTENEFHGGQIGLLGERQCGLWSVRLMGKVALGNMNQRVNINGGNDAFGAPSEGWLYSQPTNIGEYERDRFAVVPELNLNFGYRIAKNVEVNLGYSFIYWSDVVRPGDTIDRTVNPTQRFGNPLVGPARPEFDFESGDFWAQGLNCGVTWEF